MAQQALPERAARLGRPIGGTNGGAAPNAVVLLLPGGGVAHSGRRPSARAVAALLPLARRLVRAAEAADEAGGPGDRGGRRGPGGRGGSGGGDAAARDPAEGPALVAHLVHYRYRGWNGTAAHPAEDAEWAVAETVRRYGDVPVCLLGVDVGARAALRAGGHPAVASVLALGPWLPEPAPRGTGAALPSQVGERGPKQDAEQDGEQAAEGAAGSGAGSSGEPAGESAEEEPVKQLTGRHVLFVHGTNDAHTDPELSYRLAERAKKVNADVCRFEVHTDGHDLRQHHAEVAALAEDFVLGTLCDRHFARPLVDALAAPPPLGLRMPLAAGFGRTLRT